MEKQLCTLRPGQGVTLCRVEGQDALALRLREMGLVGGTRLTVTRLSPLGGAMEITFRGVRLVLRRQVAQRLWGV